MTLRNFFGSATPPGTWQSYTDGTPRIVVGHGFYFTAGSPARGSNIVGARAYVPAGHIGEDVELTLWRGANALVGVGSGIDLAGTALASVTVTIPSNDAGWVEGTFGSPVTIDSTTLYLYGAAVEFLDSPGLYHVATGARVAGLGVQHPTIPTWYWSETDTTYAGIYYRIGTGATAPAIETTNYGGADLIIDIPESNVSPTANAGVDQTVLTGATVTLNGSGSSDPDGSIVSYSWTQTSGTSVSLSGTGSSRTFVPATTGVRVFQLTVTDNLGATDTDSVTVTVNASGGGNAAPIANAGPDQSVAVNSTVTLSGSGSTDSDGTITSYAWTQTGGTSVTLSGTGANRTFTPTTTGVRTFQLTVTDNAGATGTDTVTITVNADGGGGSADTPDGTSFWGASTPPGTWSAYTDGIPSITTGTTYYFTSGSPARGADCTGGRWWCPAGYAGQTVEFGLWEATVDLPGDGVDIGTGTAVRTRSVVVGNNAAHWLEAEWDTPYTLSTAFRQVAVTTRVTSDPTRYHFGQNFRPTAETIPHSSVAGWHLTEGSGAPDYLHAFFRLGTGAQQSTAPTSWYGHDIVIDVAAAGNTAPTANAGADQTVTVGQAVTLSGSGSDADGSIASYAWVQTAGTTVTLSGSGANRTFTPSTAGVRTFRLTVTDDDGATGQDTVTITVNATGNAAPVANAGPDQSVDTGQTVTLNGGGSSDPDGTIATYAWEQTSGAAVVLSGSGATRTFTPSAAGAYTFRLTVTDFGGDTAQDTVTVTASTPSGALSVSQENAQTGHGKEHWLDGIGDSAMPAFPRSTYYLPGQTMQMSVNYNLPFTFDVYRLGHYGGLGGRRVALNVVGSPAAQPAPVAIPGGNGAVTCAAWSVNGSWTVPNDAVPGWYTITLKGTNGADVGQVIFCVSDKNNKKSTLIVASDATWHAAYNGFGGNNVYGASTAIGSVNDRAFCSTYDKPVITRANVPQTHFFNNTYPYLKWSESVGINAGVTTIEQIKNDPSILDGRSVIVWTGHNEYIPQQVMDKTKALLASGCNMVNIAGNDFFWRVKFTDGAFTSPSNGRVMWCKKDSLAGPSNGPNATPGHAAGTPFTTAADWTGTWQDTRWTLREPSYDFFGDQFIANGIRADAVTVPAAMKTSPAWRDCPGVQALTSGQTYAFAAGTLGMEWDEPHPSTELEYVAFSSTDILLSGNAADEDGAIYSVTATGNHRFMAMVSGNSYVVNFNSDQWGWALDSLHLRGSAASDVNARQMMLNVLYDLGSVANTASVQATGLTVPTPVGNFGSAYGLSTVVTPPPDPDPDPDPVGDYGWWYSDGVSWTAVAR